MLRFPFLNETLWIGIMRDSLTTVLGGVWDCSTNSIVEQLHKKLEFVEYLFRCSHNFTLFLGAECVELKPFG